MATEPFTELESYLWPRGPRRNVWMLADSARDRRIYGLLLECFYSTHVCLYADKLASEWKMVAPYLVPLEQDSRKTQKFVRSAWGKSWGVLLKCDKGADTLKRHLRGFLTVHDPKGERLLFRFYDPRVLRTYLPSCTATELVSFFGPVECFWVEGEAAGTLLEFRLSDGGSLVQRTVSLLAGAARTAVDGEPLRGAPAPAKRAVGELLKMRPEQMEAFSQAEVRKFERWMCAHLRRHFGGRCRSMDEVQLIALIQAGIARAARHRITAERDVCKFIDLMLVFGREFDTDERLAWAAEILRSGAAAAEKMQALFAAGEQLLRRS